MRYILYAGITALTCLLMIASCAEAKKSAKSGRAADYARLIEAAEQRVVPGAPGMQPYTEYRFLIVWKSAAHPESFFWYGAEGWVPCEVGKATRQAIQPGDDRWYKTEAISFDNIRKGDTLELLPVSGGKYAMPEQITSPSAKTIYFKANNTSWMPLPVTNMKKKADIIMQ